MRARRRAAIGGPPSIRLECLEDLKALELNSWGADVVVCGACREGAAELVGRLGFAAPSWPRSPPRELHAGQCLAF